MHDSLRRSLGHATHASPPYCLVIFRKNVQGTTWVKRLRKSWGSALHCQQLWERAVPAAL